MTTYLNTLIRSDLDITNPQFLSSPDYQLSKNHFRKAIQSFYNNIYYRHLLDDEELIELTSLIIKD
jgi:hypothetical protein